MDQQQRNEMRARHTIVVEKPEGSEETYTFCDKCNTFDDVSCDTTKALNDADALSARLDVLLQFFDDVETVMFGTDSNNRIVQQIGRLLDSYQSRVIGL